MSLLQKVLHFPGILMYCESVSVSFADKGTK